MQVSPHESTVTIGKRRVGAMIEYVVEDEGPGVPDHVRRDIFKAWVKMTGDTVEGVGLGLAISMAIVKGLGGSMGCEGREGNKRGARFWFMVPYIGAEKRKHSSNSYRSASSLVKELVGSDAEKKEIAKRRTRESKKISAQISVKRSCFDSESVPVTQRRVSSEPLGSSKARKILVVDDNIVNSKMLKALLQQLLTNKHKKTKKSSRKEDDGHRGKGKEDKKISIASMRDGEGIFVSDKEKGMEARHTVTVERDENRCASGAKDSLSRSADGGKERLSGSLVIDTCHNGLEACEYYKKNQDIDLIFMDINMPGICARSFLNV